MVSLAKSNVYQLRDYLYYRVCEHANTDPFKSCFLYFLGLSNGIPTFDFATLPLFQRCAISGLCILGETVSNQDVSRLLGQAAKNDLTPQPWVSDVCGVMAVKWLTEKIADSHIACEFKKWTSRFLSDQVNGKHLDRFEKDIAAYIENGKSAIYASACIPLFLHYQNLQQIEDHKNRLCMIERFMDEFREQAQVNSSTVLLSLMIYVFDQVNREVAIVPPKGWNLDDLIGFLEYIPIGLRRWTWEDTGRTKGAEPVKWSVKNEYHVQNLLYILLAPIFNDVADELNLPPVGQKNPRVDLYLPSLHTIIEVKYRKDARKPFAMFIGEIAEDASLYRVDTQYKDAKIVIFLWDHTRTTQEHAKFKEGVLKIEGINGCVVISSPSTIS